MESSRRDLLRALLGATAVTAGLKALPPTFASGGVVSAPDPAPLVGESLSLCCLSAAAYYSVLVSRGILNTDEAREEIEAYLAGTGEQVKYAARATWDYQESTETRGSSHFLLTTARFASRVRR